MARKWLELLGTTGARLALLYAGLFGVSVSVLFALIYWAATAALSDRIDQELAVQGDALIAEAGTAEDRVVTVVEIALRRPHGAFQYQVRTLPVRPLREICRSIHGAPDIRTRSCSPATTSRTGSRIRSAAWDSRSITAACWLSRKTPSRWTNCAS
jgi:hypothetical protein